MVWNSDRNDAACDDQWKRTLSGLSIFNGSLEKKLNFQREAFVVDVDRRSTSLIAKRLCPDFTNGLFSSCKSFIIDSIRVFDWCSTG